MGYSSTFVLLDDEQPHPRDVLAYTTLAIDSIRLSGSELKQLDRPYFPDFGAIRLAMIGVDHRYQLRGYGALILRAVADMAMTIADVIAVRFLLADANVTQQEWSARLPPARHTGRSGGRRSASAAGSRQPLAWRVPIGSPHISPILTSTSASRPYPVLPTSGSVYAFQSPDGSFSSGMDLLLGQVTYLVD